MAMMVYGEAPPLIRRFTWVDASNIIRGIAEKLDLKNLRADKPTPLAIETVRAMVCWSIPHDQLNRYYWVGPCAGGPEGVTALGEMLRNPPNEVNGIQTPSRDVRFEPILKGKPANEGEKGKGVDSALVLSMLTNAWNGNYQHGLLMSGDTDFSDLVSELKRHGPIIHGAAFRSRSKDPNFKQLFDRWSDLDPFLEADKSNPTMLKFLKLLKEQDVKEVKS